MLFDAHNHAFVVLGGVPRRGKERDVNAHFTAMVSHFLFEAEFCNPASGWEKGQVEKNVRDARHRLWQAVPTFPSTSDLNAWLEKRCVVLWHQIEHGKLPGAVAALDKTGHPWHRNAVSGGFSIPLLTEGDTGAFYPDFLVWKGKKVFCIDTKGGHLLSDAVARKLFDISEGDQVKLHVRFITEGKQKKLMEKPTKEGFTVWKMKSGNPTPIHVATMDDAVKECLK